MIITKIIKTAVLLLLYFSLNAQGNYFELHNNRKVIESLIQDSILNENSYSVESYFLKGHNIDHFNILKVIFEEGNISFENPKELYDFLYKYNILSPSIEKLLLTNPNLEKYELQMVVPQAGLKDLINNNETQKKIITWLESYSKCNPDKLDQKKNLLNQLHLCCDFIIDIPDSISIMEDQIIETASNFIDLALSNLIDYKLDTKINKFKILSNNVSYPINLLDGIYLNPEIKTIETKQIFNNILPTLRQIVIDNNLKLRFGILDLFRIYEFTSISPNPTLNLYSNYLFLQKFEDEEFEQFKELPLSYGGLENLELTIKTLFYSDADLFTKYVPTTTKNEILKFVKSHEVFSSENLNEIQKIDSLLFHKPINNLSFLYEYFPNIIDLEGSHNYEYEFFDSLNLEKLYPALVNTNLGKTNLNILKKDESDIIYSYGGKEFKSYRMIGSIIDEIASTFNELHEENIYIIKRTMHSREFLLLSDKDFKEKFEKLFNVTLKEFK